MDAIIKDSLPSPKPSPYSGEFHVKTKDKCAYKISPAVNTALGAIQYRIDTAEFEIPRFWECMNTTLDTGIYSVAGSSWYLIQLLTDC